MSSPLVKQIVACITDERSAWKVLQEATMLAGQVDQDRARLEQGQRCTAGAVRVDDRDVRAITHAQVPAACVPDAGIFVDDFEGGDATAWGSSSGALP